MKRIIYSAVFSFIVVAGLFIGMVRGREIRDKWMAKMKSRQEQKRAVKAEPVLSEVTLDDYEIAAYHS